MKSLITRVLIVLLTFTLCMTPEMMAQTQNPQPLDHQSNIPQTLSTQPAAPVTPSAQPPESNLPDAPTAQAPATQTPTAPATQPAANTVQSTQQQPLGTAAAEKGVTRGGAASRPAGTAIAPVKQKQVRSLLIKLGAVAAAGVALGAVYGLTKSSPSIPPGAVR
jgi:hypothetical protein